MGERYDLPVSDLITNVSKDLMQGTTDAAPMMRDVFDALIKGGQFEPITDAAISQFVLMWGQLTMMTSSAVSDLVLPAETQ